jgi:hypothetical protein
MKMNITKKRGKKREKRKKKQMGIHTREIRSEKPRQKKIPPENKPSFKMKKS